MDLTCRGLPCLSPATTGQNWPLPFSPGSAQPPYLGEGTQLLSLPWVGLSLTQAGHLVELQRSLP